MRHFIRGYLDGDGWLALRNSRNEVNLGFSNGNEDFLKLINESFKTNLGLTIGRVRKKIKITRNLKISTTYQLDFCNRNALIIADWLYKDLQKKDLFLERKYRNYIRAKKLFQFLHSGTKKVRLIQKRRGASLEVILGNLYLVEKMDGVQISRILGVHSSSIYRWLEKTGVRLPKKHSLTTYG